jgi:hypothetical protein
MMREISFLLMGIAALAGPAGAAAQGKLGQRTTSPEQILSETEAGDSDSELDQAIAAAAAHPLGSLANPVRAGGPEGAQAWLARLRCADGRAPQLGPPSPGGVGAYGTVVERYFLDCGRAAPGRVELLVDLYHEEHPETGAPAGFTIAP